MKYVAIFHANLNYAFLEPHKYEEVIRASYEVIVDTFREKHPDAQYVFEASGFTIDTIAEKTPDVLKKLRAAIESGQCEFMGSPYAHPIMANIPEEDGVWSNEFAMRSYEKHLGFRPESVWNPECTWRQYVPRAFQAVGYKYLTLDYESYKICNDKDYGWVERNRTHDIGWGGHLPSYQVDPDDKFLHQPFRDVVPGLHGMCRSDRLVGKTVGYFLGRAPLDETMDVIKKWTGKKDKGATIIIADDAEYCGTTGYFFIKHSQDYSRSFTVDPEAAQKLDKLVAAVKQVGQMITFKEACEMEPVEEPFFVEDGFAWHHTYAYAWAHTPESKRYDPIVAIIRQDYKDTCQKVVEPQLGAKSQAGSTPDRIAASRPDLQPLAESRPNLKPLAAPRPDLKPLAESRPDLKPLAESRPDLKPLAEKFWFHLTNAMNSDGRWPAPPSITCPFNRGWVEAEIESSRQALAEIKAAIGK